MGWYLELTMKTKFTNHLRKTSQLPNKKGSRKRKTGMVSMGIIEGPIFMEGPTQSLRVWS